MKIVTLISICSLIIGCSTKDIKWDEDNKIIRVKCTIGADTLDTFKNAFTRVYYGRDVYTIDFYFSTDEQNRIISEINRVNFLDLPDSLAHMNLKFDENSKSDETAFFTSGSRGDQFIDVLISGRKKKVFWIDFASYRESDEYIRLKSVMKIIHEIVNGRKEVKELPREVWY